jgi:hypothetical protein
MPYDVFSQNEITRTGSDILHWMDAPRIPITRVKIAKLREKNPDFYSQKYKSITLQNLNTMIEMLNKDKAFLPHHVDGKVTSQTLRNYFMSDSINHHLHDHPEYQDFFSTKEPDIVLTYEWVLTLDNVMKHLDSAHLNFFLYTDKSKWMNHDQLRIWIDIFFIDQNSDNIEEELKKSEQIYLKSDLHIALVTARLFSRAWCLFEIAIRKRSRETPTTYLPIFHSTYCHSRTTGQRHLDRLILGPLVL